jgi:hypothetical protein
MKFDCLLVNLSRVISGSHYISANFDILQWFFYKKEMLENNRVPHCQAIKVVIFSKATEIKR